MTRKKTNKAQDVSGMLEGIDANSYTPFTITEDNAFFIATLLQQEKNHKENLKNICKHIYLYLSLYARQLRLYDQFDYFTSQMLSAMARVPRMVQNNQNNPNKSTETSQKVSEEAPNHIATLKAMLESGLLEKLVQLFFQHEAEADVSLCILQGIVGILQDIDLHYGLYEDTVQLEAYDKEVVALGQLLTYVKEDYWPQKAKDHLDLGIVVTSIVWIFDHNMDASKRPDSPKKPISGTGGNNEVVSNKADNGSSLAQSMFHCLLEKYQHDAAKLYKICSEVSYEVVSTPLLYEHPDFISALLQEHLKQEALMLLLFRVLLNCLTVDILQHVDFIHQLVQSPSMMKFTWEMMKRNRDSSQSQLYRYVTAFFLLLLFLDQQVHSFIASDASYEQELNEIFYELIKHKDIAIYFYGLLMLLQEFDPDFKQALHENNSLAQMTLALIQKFNYNSVEQVFLMITLAQLYSYFHMKQPAETKGDEKTVKAEGEDGNAKADSEKNDSAAVAAQESVSAPVKKTETKKQLDIYFQSFARILQHKYPQMTKEKFVEESCELLMKIIEVDGNITRSQQGSLDPAEANKPPSTSSIGSISTETFLQILSVNEWYSRQYAVGLVAFIFSPNFVYKIKSNDSILKLIIVLDQCLEYNLHTQLLLQPQSNAVMAQLKVNIPPNAGFQLFEALLTLQKVNLNIGFAVIMMIFKASIIRGSFPDQSISYIMPNAKNFTAANADETTQLERYYYEEPLLGIYVNKYNIRQFGQLKGLLEHIKHVLKTYMHSNPNVIGTTLFAMMALSFDAQTRERLVALDITDVLIEMVKSLLRNEQLAAWGSLVMVVIGRMSEDASFRRTFGALDGCKAVVDILNYQSSTMVHSCFYAIRQLAQDEYNHRYFQMQWSIYHVRKVADLGQEQDKWCDKFHALLKEPSDRWDVIKSFAYRLLLIFFVMAVISAIYYYRSRQSLLQSI